MTLPRVHIVVGTRPEAVKMAPLAAALRAAGHIHPVMVATGQHTTMVTQALAAFDQRPDVSLDSTGAPVSRSSWSRSSPRHSTGSSPRTARPAWSYRATPPPRWWAG